MATGKSETSMRPSAGHWSSYPTWIRKQSYVPRTFEGAAVHESLAAHTLEEAMGKALFKQIPGVYEETLRSEGGHMIFELHWTGVEPEVPIELRDLPNLRIVEQAHLQYTLDSAQRS
ncbi:hypothetical protein FQN52_004397, partial [Onygenales sp. PD_12]